MSSFKFSIRFIPVDDPNDDRLWSRALWQLIRQATGTGAAKPPTVGRLVRGNPHLAVRLDEQLQQHWLPSGVVRLVQDSVYPLNRVYALVVGAATPDGNTARQTPVTIDDADAAVNSAGGQPAFSADKVPKAAAASMPTVVPDAAAAVGGAETAAGPWIPPAPPVHPPGIVNCGGMLCFLDLDSCSPEALGLQPATPAEADCVTQQHGEQCGEAFLWYLSAAYPFAVPLTSLVSEASRIIQRAIRDDLVACCAYSVLQRLNHQRNIEAYCTVSNKANALPQVFVRLLSDKTRT